VGDLHGLDRPPRWRLRLAAVLASALLSLLFLLVYGATNWLAAQRSDVPTWYFEWERYIPFVPLMILPYMSIDLFFIAAPFLCRDGRELRTFAMRIAFAILVAGAFFLFMPLRFAFERPSADGWLGAIFDKFREMDQPYNLFPSLHITLRAILVEVYLRRTRALLRAVVHIWFSLIGFSTILTYQHHVIDVVGGFMLAGFCFFVFTEQKTRLPVVPNFRVAGYYGIATLATLLPALHFRPWGALLFWPAASFAIMTAAFCGLGPGVFRKTAGRLPRSTRFVLAPILFGHWLSWLFYKRQCRPWDRITSNLWIGRALSDAEAARAVQDGVTAVLDLTAEFDEPLPFRNLAYRQLPVLDLTAPTPAQLAEALAFIRDHLRSGIVYIHCKIGYSRSAAIVGAALIASGEADSADAAVARLREARPSIVVRPEIWTALRAFERSNRVGVAVE
jgi:protein-tyrosine phosphatase/membrane-associated phospholipid phosphatase